MSFIQTAGWGDATREPLAGDASTRRYTRLRLQKRTAMLMEDPDGDVATFARLARHLRSIGLSAPEIFAEAPGYLLLEDFGDGLVSALATSPALEKRLYLTATDALIALHKHPAPAGLPIATPAALAQMTDLAFDCYAAQAGAPNLQAQNEVITALAPLLEHYGAPENIMILRDYHAENVLYLPDRSGAAQAGLLDFQDAMVGHRAYDLASLIHDARRTPFEGTGEACVRHYLAPSGLDDSSFRCSLAVLGAQRNLRILGIFARLARVRQKPHYIDFIPTTWAHLQRDLAHPVLAPVKALLDRHLPTPTPEILDRLKSCPTP
jgi:aminoglycoside/choline kinase family phosphotransferase